VVVIARLRGLLIDRRADRVVVDCAGVGYEALVSASTLASLPEVGSEVTLRVHTHFTQERFTLIGFATAQEQELFLRLITVDKVGPAAAITMLSGARPVDVARMIAAEDVAGLSSIKGIGKKTAEKLIFSLKDGCQLLLASWGAGGGAADPARPGRVPVLDEVASALVGLGYRQAAVDKAIGELMPGTEATVEQLLREALQAMPR
jgi:holliday junction DNA helicase RuvA